MKLRSISSKKGSLSLSMEAIVVVVLAMTLLGLGLTFVRNMFKDIGSTTGEVQAQVRDQILGTLRTGTDKLALQSNQVNLETGESKLFAIGVANKDPTSIDITLNISIVQAQRVDKLPFVGDEVDFFYVPGPYTLGVGDGDAYNLRLTAGNDKGVYLVKVIVDKSALDQAGQPTTVQYATKTFFVNVV